MKGKYRIDVIDDSTGKVINSIEQENKVFRKRIDEIMNLSELMMNGYALSYLIQQWLTTDKRYMDKPFNVDKFSLPHDLNNLHYYVKSFFGQSFNLSILTDDVILDERPNFVLDENFRIKDLLHRNTVLEPNSKIGFSHIDSETPIHKGKYVDFLKWCKYDIVYKYGYNVKMPVTLIKEKNNKVTLSVNHAFSYQSLVSEKKPTETVHAIGLKPSVFVSEQSNFMYNPETFDVSQLTRLNDKPTLMYYNEKYGLDKIKQLLGVDNITNDDRVNKEHIKHLKQFNVLDELLTFSELQSPLVVNYLNNDGSKSTKTFNFTYTLEFTFDIPEGLLFFETLVNQIPKGENKISVAISRERLIGILYMLFGIYNKSHRLNFNAVVRNKVIQTLTNYQGRLYNKDVLVEIVSTFLNSNPVLNEFARTGTNGYYRTTGEYSFSYNNLRYNTYYFVNFNEHWYNDNGYYRSYRIAPYRYINNQSYGISMLSDNKKDTPKTFTGTTYREIYANHSHSIITQSRIIIIPLCRFSSETELKSFYQNLNSSIYDSEWIIGQQNNNTERGKWLYHYRTSGYLSNGRCYLWFAEQNGKVFPVVIYFPEHSDNINIHADYWKLLYNSDFLNDFNKLRMINKNVEISPIIDGFINIDLHSLGTSNLFSNSSSQSLTEQITENAIRNRNAHWQVGFTYYQDGLKIYDEPNQKYLTVIENGLNQLQTIELLSIS